MQLIHAAMIRLPVPSHVSRGPFFVEYVMRERGTGEHMVIDISRRDAGQAEVEVVLGSFFTVRDAQYRADADYGSRVPDHLWVELDDAA